MNNSNFINSKFINNKINNNFAYAERRRVLIKQLMERFESDSLDENVLEAMSILPRELFVNPAYINRAYEDTALPIDCEQTISQPFTVAFMTSLLKVKKNERILEIGTGSGYQAAILSMLGCKVFTIERISQLYENSNKLFKELNFNIVQRLADGSIGWQEFAPYDGIIITAAAPEIPKSMLKQLIIGGRMVVPVGNKDTQTMYLINKKSETEFENFTYDKFKFVPLIGKAGWDLSQ